MKQAGLTLAQTLLMAAAVAVAAAIVVLFSATLNRRNDDAGTMERLRRVYVAVSLYQFDNQSAYPPFLDDVLRDLDGPTDLQSSRDPFLSAPGPYPRDAGLLEGPKGKHRISLLYLPAHRDAGKVGKDAFRNWEGDPLGALLILPWHGTVAPGANFGAEVSGKQIRIQFDGSATSREVKEPTSITDSLKMFAPQ